MCDRNITLGITGGINMKRWPLLGMYQPDTIQVITVGGKNFLVTANEGDSKDYSKWGGFNEETRIKYISLSGKTTKCKLALCVCAYVLLLGNAYEAWMETD